MINTYQRKIVELTRELTETREKAAEADARHKQTVRQLKAQISEGTSPALIVAQQENRTLRSERDEAAATTKMALRRYAKSFTIVCDHMRRDHRMTGPESMEWWAARIGEAPVRHDYFDDDGELHASTHRSDDMEPDAPILLNLTARNDLPVEGVEAIERARWQRW